MPPPEPTTTAPALTARALADAWVETLADLDPTVGTALGIRPGDTRMPDLSADALAERAAAARAVLAELADLPEPTDDDDRRCATLLRERLGATLAVHDTGADLVSLRPLASPVQQLQSIFTLMPADSPADVEVIAGRLENVPAAAASYRAALAEGLARGHRSAPRQAHAVWDQLQAWSAVGDGRGWHADFAAGLPATATLRTRLDAATARCATAVAGLRDWIAAEYLPAVADVPDAVGPEAYAVAVRHSLGTQIDPEEAYAWGWEELARIEADMRAEAVRVLPGASVAEALAHLETAGEAIEGVTEVREYLQGLMDQAITDLDGTLVDIPAPVRRVEARIAPPGAAAAPYYTRPSLDLTRPGRTWLPTLGRTRFPTWDLVSTWYHEGVPGHHLQLGTWAARAADLSRFQVSVGSVSATTEGWALYAERLMDELGHLRTPGERLGYLDSQRMRAVRVIIDIGMHLRLAIPAGAPGVDPALVGRTWDADLGRDFFATRSGLSAAFIDSEIERYLGWPGQAISYKLGERAWRAGRAAAEARPGFDLKSWHNAALGLGSLGLADLERELGAL